MLCTRIARQGARSGFFRADPGCSESVSGDSCEKNDLRGSFCIHFNEDLSTTDMRIVLQLADEPLSEYADALRSRLGASELAAYDGAVHAGMTAVLYAVDEDNQLEKPIDVLFITAPDVQSLEAWAQDLQKQLAEGHRVHLDNVFAADVCPAEDDYGVALLNNGNIACSVEGENMLNLMLFHTADFYGNRGRVTGAEQLIPEQKTYMASYALYPHAGSYREARLYQKAMEFNDPLMSAEKTGTEGGLPSSKSFLRCPDNFLITCFKAGGYDMAGNASENLTISRNEIPYDLPPYAAQEWELRVQKNAPDAEGILRMEYEDMGQQFEDRFEVGYFEPVMTIEDQDDQLVVTIANYTDQYLAGELELASPIETWDIPFNPHVLSSLSCGQIRVELAPGDRKIFVFPWNRVPGNEILTGSADKMCYSFWAVAKLMMNGHIFFAYTHRKGEKHICSTYDYTGRIAADDGSVRCLYERFRSV